MVSKRYSKNSICTKLDPSLADTLKKMAKENNQSVRQASILADKILKSKLKDKKYKYEIRF